MTKQIFSILIFIALIIAGCASEEPVPTQVSLPTDSPTELPTQTAAPTDIPPPTPTDLIIPQTAAQNPNEQAYIRVIHASPDLGTVDVYIESLAVATNVDYGRFNERQGIVAGRYNLRVLSTGSFVTDAALYEEQLTIFGGQSLIFVLTGTDEAVQMTTLFEPNDPLRSDASRLVLLNAVQGVDNMVMVVDDTPQTTVTPYLQLSETTEYGLGVSDFAFQSGSETLFETTYELRQRQNYIFLLTGVLSRPDTMRLVVLNSTAPGQTTISFINASQSPDLLDLYFGEDLFLGGADYGEISVPTPILSGTYDLSIYSELANPEENEPITGTQLIANPDEDIILILIGEPSSMRFVIYRNDQEPTYDNRARITFVNAVESVPTILMNSTRDELTNRLSYGRVSETFEIDTDQSISFTWIQQLDDSQDIALENYSDFVPEAGKNYLYIFTANGYEPPVVLFSIDVGTLGFEYAEVVEVTNVPTARPTRLRFVNMWENRPFNVRLDGTVIAENIAYGAATNMLIVDSGVHLVTFYEAETDTPVIEITNEFLPANDYSIIPYNLQSGEGDILVINDTNAVITSASGGIRLIVLEANSNSIFGVGYSQPSPNITQPDASEGYRRSLSAGVTQVIREISAYTASEAQRVPTGTYNIRIIDNDEAAVTYTHTEQVIEPQTLYNVFLREDERTRQTTTLIIPYSAR